MILVKIKGTIPTQERERVKEYFEFAFPNEKVLLINSEMVELQFINEGKKRCAYCSTLNEEKDGKCSSCGGSL